MAVVQVSTSCCGKDGGDPKSSAGGAYIALFAMCAMFDVYAIRWLAQTFPGLRLNDIESE